METQDVAGVEALARLLVEETARPRKHALHAQSLVASLVTGLLDLNDACTRRETGRLTAQQMRRIEARLDANGGRRLTIIELAGVVGLSESWFGQVFKKTTGQTPLQWQLGNRVDLARRLLADTDLSVSGFAAELGFTDQAHLTRVFHRAVGETPAAWRRRQGGSTPVLHRARGGR